MSHAPWSKEQAEKWVQEYNGLYDGHTYSIIRRDAIEWVLEKAAEMIEASPTIVQMEPGRQFGWYDERDHLHHKYQRQAKLVNVKPIEKEKER